MNYLFSGVSLQNARFSNMDSLLLKYGFIGNKKAFLAVVCDGVGSLADGAFASGAAVKILNRWFDSMAVADRIGLRMRDKILEINVYIISEAKRKNMNTASTLSALLLTENDYYLVHIGDSRVYSYENEALTALTNDDVSETGKLTACIGQTENIVLQYSEGAAADKVFLLCSDGLYKRMDTNYLAEKMKAQKKHEINRSVKMLTRYVIERGERDNISVAIVKIEN